MDEVEQKIVDEFGWPCDKRTAHGPHPLPADPRKPLVPRTCKGVNAHPLCMIGRR